jgi:hypothetical protein
MGKCSVLVHTKEDIAGDVILSEPACRDFASQTDTSVIRLIKGATEAREYLSLVIQRYDKAVCTREQVLATMDKYPEDRQSSLQRIRLLNIEVSFWRGEVYKVL